MNTFIWPVTLNEKRLRGIYKRRVEVIEQWDNQTLISITTEKGKITITTDEIKRILSWLEKKGE